MSWSMLDRVPAVLAATLAARWASSSPSSLTPAALAAATASRATAARRLRRSSWSTRTPFGSAGAAVRGVVGGFAGRAERAAVRRPPREDGVRAFRDPFRVSETVLQRDERAPPPERAQRLDRVRGVVRLLRHAHDAEVVLPGLPPRTRPRNAIREPRDAKPLAKDRVDVRFPPDDRDVVPQGEMSGQQTPDRPGSEP